MLTKEDASKVLSYCPETGQLTWVDDRSASRVSGQIAGSLDRSGHRRVKINGRRYFAHRVAWLLQHGEWPLGHLDHINGNPDDNRLSNLRPCTPSQNMANARAPTNNTSGIKGVSRSSRGQRWRALIRHNGKLHHLGTFDTRDEAAAAYARAAHALFGSFARTVDGSG